jgi:hypothetical protein
MINSFPSIYYFNPTCEMAVANSIDTYQPPEILVKFEQQLSNIFMYSCQKDDIVIVNDIPNNEFLDNKQYYGFSVPVFEKTENLSDYSTFKDIVPWGWSPSVHRLFVNEKSKCLDNFKQSKMYNWKLEHSRLYNRKTYLELLKNIILINPKVFINVNKVGETVSDISCLDTYWQKWGKIVIKTPYSSSGRGVFILKQKGDFINKISNAIEKQGFVIVEPFFEKIHDFSLQFFIDEFNNAEYKGYSHFNADEKGKYSGQLIGDWEFHNSVKEFFLSKDFLDFIEIVKTELQDSFYAHNYSGWLGIDSMLVNDNGLKIHPLVEVNCRNTMGMIAMNLSKHIHPQSKAIFQITHSYNGFDISEFNKIKMLDGYISSGELTLNPINKKTVFRAILRVERDK